MPAANRRDALTVQRLKTAAAIDPATGEMAVESEDNWEDYFVCFGEVIVKGQREFTRAGIIDADVSHIIRVPRSRETDAINSQFRVVLEDTGNVLHIMDAYRRDASSRETEMICRS
jgi:head-tail adaptor